MSVEIALISALMSSLTASGVVDKVSEILRQRLQEKGVERVPDPSAEKAPKTIEAALLNAEPRLGVSGVRDLTLEAIQAAHDAATNVRNERMRQARITFNAALALAVLGVLIIFAGVALLLLRNAVTAGALTAGVGAITEVISAVLFRLNHETNNRLDEIGRDLSAIEAARIAMSLIAQIADPAKRDDAIMELAKDLRSRRPEPLGRRKKVKTA